MGSSTGVSRRSTLLSDGGLFGLVGDISIAAATVAAWIVLLRARPVRAAMVVLPPVLTFLTVDKTFRLHDHIPHWLVFYLPLLAGTFVAVAAVARRLSPRCLRLTAVGLVLLIASFLLHLYGEWLLHYLGGSDTGWLFQVKAAVKHGWRLRAGSSSLSAWRSVFASSIVSACRSDVTRAAWSGASEHQDASLAGQRTPAR